MQFVLATDPLTQRVQLALASKLQFGQDCSLSDSRISPDAYRFVFAGAFEDERPVQAWFDRLMELVNDTELLLAPPADSSAVVRYRLIEAPMPPDLPAVTGWCGLLLPAAELKLRTIARPGIVIIRLAQPHVQMAQPTFEPSGL